MSDVRSEWYELRNALERADFTSAAALLQSAPSLIDDRNGIGETVLHFLAVENNRSAVEWLHARGGDLNTVNQFGTPVIFEIARLGYRSLCLWLIQHGADPDRRNGYGQSLEEYLREAGCAEMIAVIKSQR